MRASIPVLWWSVCPKLSKKLFTKKKKKEQKNTKFLVNSPVRQILSVSQATSQIHNKQAKITVVQSKNQDLK
jgi:hypothetical protein